MSNQTRYNARKRVIKNQKYENYTKSTLAFTNFKGVKFIRTLRIIVEHIDKYDLANKSKDELLQSPKRLNPKIVFQKELEKTIQAVFPNDDETGLTTRKQINTFIKLGFIKPYLQGYPQATKTYISDMTSSEERSRIFSDIVYEYASLNSSQTIDNSKENQIKYIVNTLINREGKYLTSDELLGIMKIDPLNKKYATEKEILESERWVSHIDFKSRKYNQLSHFFSILSKMNLFKVIIKTDNVNHTRYRVLCLAEDAGLFLPVNTDVTRDTYRFGVMKKAVIEETIRVYNKRVSWYSKQESESLVVSHIYASASALSNWDFDSAYDPNNAILLKPGDEDQYFDKHKMTFDNEGIPIFSKDVRKDFIDDANRFGYRLDASVLTPSRLKYLENHHQQIFNSKYNKE